MKYDCSNEFDLDEIYCKLVGGGSHVGTVAMSDFFSHVPSLAEFQQSFEVGAPSAGHLGQN